MSKQNSGEQSFDEQNLERLIENERRIFFLNLADKVFKLARRNQEPADFRQQILLLFQLTLDGMKEDYVEKPDIEDFTWTEPDDDRPFVSEKEIKRVMPLAMEHELWKFAVERTFYSGPLGRGVYVDDLKAFLETLEAYQLGGRK